MPVTPAAPCFVWVRYPGLSKSYNTQKPGDGYWDVREKAHKFDSPAHGLAFLLSLAKADRMDHRLEYGVESVDGTSMIVVKNEPVKVHHNNNQGPHGALCYSCQHRHDLIGSAHSGCKNFHARVKGNDHEIKNGWFDWPLQFDPIWLNTCTGYKSKERAKTCWRCNAEFDSFDSVCSSCREDLDRETRADS